jgi:hypothetical protein
VDFKEVYMQIYQENRLSVVLKKCKLKQAVSPPAEEWVLHTWRSKGSMTRSLKAAMMSRRQGHGETFIISHKKPDPGEKVQ